MEISINEQNQEWLKQKVASGEFATADDVLEKARQLLDERDQALAEELEDVRAKVGKGIEAVKNGDYTEYTDETLHELFDDISKRGHEWLKSRNNAPSA